MLGVGLGGFMEGFNKSQDMLQKRDEAARKQVLADRTTKEYERLTAQRDAIDGINADAKATFDAQVAAGTQEPADFLDWYQTHTVPKLTQTYLLNDDRESAAKVTEWANTHEAKTGARLFRSSVTKALSGDGAGAVEDAMKIGKLKGYINNGYEVLGQEALLGQDGAQQGYRIKLRTPDGKDIMQDVRTQDLPKLIATFGNPETAWESQVAARSQADKDKKELETYEAKKKIDRQYGIGPTKDRGAAISALRKRFDGGMGDETKFDDMPRPEQEKLINAELELVQGQPGLGGQGAPAPAEKKVLVDTTTGKPVSSAAKPAPTAKQETKTAPATQSPPSAEKRILGVPERAQAGVRSRMEGLQRSATTDAPGLASSGQDEALQQANVALRKGIGVDEVAAALHQAGVPEWQWPTSVQEELRRRQKSFGLNP
ncbi:hypothetical protein [Agrobacterium tumefaciens]|uniref:hypothetical protein n=1 Tax=Agrobacterium tumefaciens TaxID=358 RepID=UPI000618787B|nr:hypothetical protein [Agrobacterium tumefaciens]AKC07183.1 hypothetical protein Ach5_14070 [Agrobacterium tumefaciens]AYM67324.1 hypothetical protein AtA6_11070 [Agrobacterium tumefaciens]NIB54917.1 hypothetical protein [Agrobacterium tumefaciens]NSZ21634.1 hypothetical protein [Agrobacterium tumefaciens]QQE32529.1 hypothetical protein I6I05_11280 [Agrobacterium tumefaciens]